MQEVRDFGRDFGRLHSEPSDGTAEPPARDEGSHEQRRRLHHDKAEAIARYNEGAQLNRYRQDPHGRGQEQPTFTHRQWNLLEKWDCGELLKTRNRAIVALGHGRLVNAQGDHMDIGGSTGGGSRRIIDSWQPPDWSDVLPDEQES